MTIQRIEDIKQITIWSPVVERWELKWEPEKYLRMYLKFLTFRDSDLSYLNTFSQEIIGKSDTHFVSWLIAQSKTQEPPQLGHPVFYFIDNAFLGNYNDYKMEQYFIEDSQENIPLGSQKLDDLMFEMGWRQADSQPTIFSDKIFLDEQSAIELMLAEFPFFQNINEDRSDGF